MDKDLPCIPFRLSSSSSTIPSSHCLGAGKLHIWAEPSVLIMSHYLFPNQSYHLNVEKEKNWALPERHRSPKINHAIQRWRGKVSLGFLSGKWTAINFADRSRETLQNVCNLFLTSTVTFCMTTGVGHYLWLMHFLASPLSLPIGTKPTGEFVMWELALRFAELISCRGHQTPSSWE